MLLVDVTAVAWQADAACADNDAVGWDDFFPPDGKKSAARRARAVCAGCLVRDDCLEFALDHFIRDGVWGGTTERDRRPMWRERRRLAS
jgi:WhiB family redox-sensing transcriptional regulator